MEETKRKRSIAKAQFTRTENSLYKLLDSKDSLEETIRRKLQEMQQKWQKVQDVHDLYMTMIDEEETHKEESWIDELLVRFDELEGSTDKILHMRTEASQAVEKRLESTPDNPEHLLEKNRVQLERLKLDKFDGDMRKYPGFRERFKLYIEPMCPKSQAAFVLRSHLEAAVKEEVENVADDLQLLWQRLDSKYGNLRKYVDIVLQELSKVSKGDGTAALGMINTVEKAYMDLVRIGAGQEMSNSYIIAMIEKKMPEEMRMDWVKFIAEKDKVDSSATFKLLMGFLKKWRKIIEYDAAAIRKGPEKKSGTTNLATNPAAAKQCNMTKSETCWLHEDGKHPVWNCKKFQAMPIAEKMDLIKSKNACHACLETSCKGAQKPEECAKKFKCRYKGCEKPHNILIHQ